MNAKVRIVHFHNGTGGGILTVIRNLLRYRQHPEVENHVIYTINQEQQSHYAKPGLEGATSEQVFYYSPKWNFYHTCRKLAKLLPDNKAIIVAHDWLELGMVSNLGLQNPVVHYVHGAYDYYYKLAERHSLCVDCYIAVAKDISKELQLRLPEKKEVIHYYRFPVPQVDCNMYRKGNDFKIVFVGRCDEAKGYTLLPLIENHLQIYGIRVQWHIAGVGSNDVELQKLWPENSDIFFHGLLDERDLFNLLCMCHSFILPSKAEGMPLSLIEAMKAGTVPIVNDLPGGIQELVNHSLTGFKIPDSQVSLYAAIIKELFYNRKLTNFISIEAQAKANKMFDPISNTERVENAIVKASVRTRNKTRLKAYGSKLDQPWLPNVFVKTLRMYL